MLMGAGGRTSILRRDVKTNRAVLESAYRVRAIGEYWLVREDRETGEILGKDLLGRNAIQADGIAAFLELGAGIGNQTPFDQANSRIRVRDPQNTVVFTQDQADANYPTWTGNLSLQWRWSDISAETYTVKEIEFGNKTTNKVFSLFTPSNWSKPASQNWIYIYNLALEPDEEFNVAKQVGEQPPYFNMDYSGIKVFLEAFIGENSIFWDDTNLKARVWWLTNPPQPSDVDISSGPTRTGNQLLYEFVAPPNVANGPWDWIDIYKDEPGEPMLRRHNDNEGSKDPNSEWTWRYRLILST